MTTLAVPWTQIPLNGRKIAERHAGKTVEAWDSPADAAGFTAWTLALNDDGCTSTVARVATRTERDRRRDLSGRRKWRVRSLTTYRVTIRYGRYEFAIPDDYVHSGGEIDAVRYLARSLALGDASPWHITASIAIETACRKAGASDRSISDAHYVRDGDAGWPALNARLLRLLTKHGDTQGLGV